MVDCAIEALPWLAIHTDLRRLAGAEARRLPVAHGAADDAAQEACAKLIRIGVRDLPPDLLGENRGAWLRLVVRNVLRTMAREEGRWRHANGAVGAANSAGRDATVPYPTFDEPSDLSWLPAQEWRVITFLRMGLTLDEISGLEGTARCDVVGRARWGGFRLRVPNGRRTLHLGREPGSMAKFRGQQRRGLLRLLHDHGWTPAELGSDFAATPNAVRHQLRHVADRPFAAVFELQRGFSRIPANSTPKPD